MTTKAPKVPAAQEPQEPVTASPPKVVHDAYTEASSGFTPCCGRDPRQLSGDAFTLDHGDVTCTGGSDPEAG